MGRPSPPAWLCGQWQVTSRPCHSGMGARAEATQGSVFWPRQVGVEEKVVMFALMPSAAWLGAACQAQADICSVVETETTCQRWPVVRLQVSCCSVSRPVTTCISHISCPLLSKLHRAGQDCCRKPPKEGHKEGPWQRHHPSWDTAGCPSPRGQERDRNRVALDAESGCSRK